jgi:O-antigen/teichoic acid export membrane protein
MSNKNLKNKFFDRFKKFAALDFHILVTLILRGWSIIAGGATVVMIPLWFTSVEQGYYYAFSSLIALQIFFELGMNQVVVQIVGHEMAHLKMQESGALSGEDYRIRRLASLAKFLKRWYVLASLIFVLSVGIFGFYFFANKGGLPLVKWVGAWILLVLSAGVNFYFSPQLAFMEGCNQVGQVARLRLNQSIVGMVLMWAGFAAGFGLWSAAAVPLAAAAYTGFWFFNEAKMLKWLRRIEVAHQSDKVSWGKEVFPFQWRIAVSWVSGYFIFQLFVPLVFANQGAVEAGKFGMALSIFSALQSIGMSWVSAKTPVFAGYISRNEFKELNEVFASVLKPSMLFSVMSSLILIVILYILQINGQPIALRVSPLPVLLSLGGVTVINGYIFAAAVYMRAHKQEPMMVVSIVMAIFVLVTASIASRVSVELTAFLYFLLTASISLPWTHLIFRRYRAEKRLMS